MTKPLRKIAIGVGEFLLLVLLSLVPPLFVLLDAVLLKTIDPRHGFPEISLTEITQEVLLLASALAFWYGAWRFPHSRGFIMLVAGFFSCMLIRELDTFFDHVWKGFWFWPAISMAIATIAYVVIYCRDTVLSAMSDFIDTKPYLHIMFGLVVVLAFSRVFGSGSLIWKHLLSDVSIQVAKGAMQEGLELFGYIFIAYGSFLFFRGNRLRHDL